MADKQTIEQRAAERAARKEKNAKARRAYRAKQKAKRAERGGGAAAAAAAQPEARAHGPGRPKVRQGVVVSAKPGKTISVRIDVARRHRMYKKIVRESTTLKVHDERNDANEGDL